MRHYKTVANALRACRDEAFRSRGSVFAVYRSHDGCKFGPDFVVDRIPLWRMTEDPRPEFLMAYRYDGDQLIGREVPQ